MRTPTRRAKRLLARAWRAADPVLDVFDGDRSRCFPSDYDVIDGYKDRFTDTARVFELFLKRSDPDLARQGDDPVGVVVMPWFGTPSPWYAVAIGLGLARRGRAVDFVWHDACFPGPSAYERLQNDEIGRVMHKLRRRFPVLRLSEQHADPEARPDDDAIVDRLVEANLTWSLRGATPTQEDNRVGSQMAETLADAFPRVRALMHGQGYDYVVVSGGLVGPSGLYVEAGHAAGVRVATFDAGFGATAIDTNGVAAQHTDTARAFDLLAEDVEGRFDEVVEAAHEEFERRRSGLDHDRYQVARPGLLPPGVEQSVLIPLSVVFDAAALGLHHLFADSEEWLVETIRALLEQTGDPILVRQHPSERRPLERSRFDVRAILDDAFGSNPQVRFIPAEEDVSTYDLLDATRLVLPFVSTIGMEAAALGKPVIVSGSVYYGDLGFVWAPKTRDDYLDLVRSGARGELPLLPDQVDRAWRCFYLNSCHRVMTNFTPQPPDFWRWVARQPDELYRDPGVVDILSAIDEDVPLSVIRHRRRQRDGTSAARLA